MFYCQAEDTSRLLVERVRKKKKRGRRPIEDLFAHFKDRVKLVDRSFYKEYLDAELSVEYLHTLKKVRAMYGSLTCRNFLNPGYFYCHVRGCPKPGFHLRRFNSVCSIKDHLTNRL